jgi:eukaryotic-like serine/threonine-protein kinase
MAHDEDKPRPGAETVSSTDTAGSSFDSESTTPTVRLVQRATPASAVETPPGLDSPAPGSSLPIPSGFSDSVHITIPPNDLLAGRFRLIRSIGRGGMGQVYEAEDIELREHVALKAIRPEIAQDPRSVERFKREIHLARQVTHRNVCRIFDVFRHPVTTPDGASAGEMIFLSMELLSGETLAERLSRKGPMTTTTALPLVRQMAGALAAAHKEGIVHRDFKSQNVILVAGGDSAQEPRAVVTDFGLARAAGVDKFAASATGISDFVGSPPYMAPEQVEGGRVGPAADLYALGVVMYEMVAGRHPFVGDTPLATAMKRLKEPPPTPRTYVPDLDRKWERTILRCLKRDPRDRFESASDIVKALTGDHTKKGRRDRIQQAILAGASMILLVVGAIYGPRVLRKTSPPGAVVNPVKTRPAIAVLGFKNLSGKPESAWLSTAISEMLSTDLATDGQLRSINGEDVARVKIALSLPDADSFAKDTLDRLRKNLGANLVVVGSYVILGQGEAGQLRVDLRLQETSSGDTIATVSEAGATDKLFDLVERGGRAVREKLGVGQLSADEAVGIRAAIPSNPEAARLYSEGLAELRRFDALAARASLQKAVALDPRHALAHSALAAAWAALGYEKEAEGEASKSYQLANDLSQPADLPQQDRLMVAGRYWEMSHDWNQAVRTYTSLFDFFPDNTDYGLALANAQTAGGRGKDALETLARLRKLPPLNRDDGRIDLAEAQAAESLSDFKRELAAAAQAVEKGSADGAPLLVARGRRAQGSAYQDLGQLDQATAAFLEAQKVFSAAGDRGNAAAALNDLALVQGQQGHWDRALQMYHQALVTYQAIGDRKGAAGILNNIGIVRWQQGDLAGARKMYSEALATFRQTGNREGTARVLNDLGFLLWQQDDLAGGRARLDEALTIFREIGNDKGAAAALYNSGKMLMRQGDLAAARKQEEESLALFLQVGDRDGTAQVLVRLGRVLLQQGDLEGARQKMQEATTVAGAIGARFASADAHLGLAEVALARRSFPEAENLAREAADGFASEESAENEARACTFLGRALLGEGKRSDAQAVIGRATSAAQRSGIHYERLRLAITAARVQAASGERADRTEAGKELRLAADEATQIGLVALQLEARLAQAEVSSTKSSQNRARLRALQQDAAAKGFGLIAQEAARLLQ